MAGYNEMLRRIEPEKIICYHTPFPEMRGNIVYVDYERSSWKYLGYECGRREEDLEAFKIGGTNRAECDMMEPYRLGSSWKGGGSAYGADWKPPKPADFRLVGVPGSINYSYTKNGELYQTHIGAYGYADMERHNTTHDRDDHTNPHDHKITWEGNHPNWGKHIDYSEGTAPDFERMFEKGKMYMEGKTFYMLPGDSRFDTISDFKWCLKCGGEIRFRWKGQDYGVVRYGLHDKITVYRSHDDTSQRTYDSSDEALEYMVGSDRLRDIITEVEVTERTI